MRTILRFGVYSILYFGLVTLIGLGQASKTVSVRLPVSVRAGDSILEPGSYQMELENDADGQILVYIRKADNSKILATRKATFQPSDTKAEKNAVKVLFRDGSYLLEKLLIMGETKILIFQP
jgi:hypothetical protein